MARLAAFLAVLTLAFPGRTTAQGETRTDMGARVTHTSGYPGRDLVHRRREKKAFEARKAEIRRRSAGQAPVPPKLVAPPTLPPIHPSEAPNVHVYDDQPVVFRDFQEILREKREKAKAASSGSPAGRTLPARPARGPRTARSLGDLSLTRSQELERLLEQQRETDVRRSVRELGEGGPVTGLRLAQETLRAQGKPPPVSGAELRRVGREIAPDRLRAGDLLFFRVGDGTQARENVGVFYEAGKFAYPTRQGIRLGDLDEPRWRERLVAARRP